MRVGGKQSKKENADGLGEGDSVYECEIICDSERQSKRVREWGLTILTLWEQLTRLREKSVCVRKKNVSHRIYE